MDSLAEWFWWFLAFYLICIYFMMLFRVIGDVFRSNDMGGWAKSGWLIFLLFVPILALLIYVVARGSDMAARDVAQLERARVAQEDYIRAVATSAPANPSAGAATQIQQGQQLLQAGAITQAEFDTLKAKALA